MRNLNAGRYTLGIRKDLSKEPELFGKPLRIKGLYVWGRLKSITSLAIQNMEFDIILHNETDPKNVPPPKDYMVFKIKDLQEFPYIAWVKAHEEKKKT